MALFVQHPVYFKVLFQPLLHCVKFPGAFWKSFYALLLPLLVSIMLFNAKLFIVIRHSCFDITLLHCSSLFKPVWVCFCLSFSLSLFLVLRFV